MTSKLYEYDVKQYTLSCSNSECPRMSMSETQLDDWLTQHGRTLFWIDTPQDTFSGVYDVFENFDHGSFEYYWRHKICCSLCDSAADSECSGSLKYVTTNADNPFFNAPD